MYQDSNFFFEIYYKNQNRYDFFATRKKQNIVVKVKNTDHVLDTFNKKSLVIYYESQGKLYRFNTCPHCNKVDVFESFGGFSFGKYAEPEIDITETQNPCDYASQYFWKWIWGDISSLCIPDIVKLYESFSPDTKITYRCKFHLKTLENTFEFVYNDCGRWQGYDSNDTIFFSTKDKDHLRIFFLDIYLKELKPSTIVICYN